MCNKLIGVVYLILFLFLISCACAVIDEESIGSNLLKNGSTKKSNFESTLSSDLSENVNYDEINVIANQDNPVIFTFPSAKFSKFVLITDTSEYLKSIPGFSMMRNGGTNNEPVFRGMVGSQLRIFMDNSEILGACLSHMDPSSSYIATDTFDVLNIIKGPQTVLWGPVVTGGILHFQRYHPDFNVLTMQLKSNVTIGSNNSLNKNIDTILGNRLGYIRLIGNYSCSDDYRDGNNYRVYSAWHKWNTDAILSFNYGTDTHVQINFGQGDGNVNYATRAMDGRCFARDSYALRIETSDISSIINKAEFYIWYNNIHHIMINKNLGSDVIPLFLCSSKKKHCCYSSSNKGSNHIGRCLWGMRGIVSYQLENIQHYSGIDFQINQHKKSINSADIYQIDTISQDSGIFTEFSYDIALNSKLLGGARLEYCHMINMNSNNVDDHQNEVIYPAGFIRYESHINPACLYYIGLGTSQRFPDYLELISVRCRKDGKKSDDDILKLKPEKTIQMDLGVSFQGSKISGWMSSYVGYIKDYIFYDNIDHQIHSGFDFYINNVRAQICGSEMGLTYKLSKYLYGESNVSWEYGMNLNDKCILPTISPLRGVFNWSFKRQYYNVGVSWKVVSSSQCIDKFIFSFMNVNNSTYFKSCTDSNKPGFGILSIYVVLDSSKYYTCSVGVNNVFNKSYQESIVNIFNIFDQSEYFRKIQIYEPGRTWWIRTGISL